MIVRSLIYRGRKWGPGDDVYDWFPVQIQIRGRVYRQSLLNPSFIRNTSKNRAEKDRENARAGGWLAEIVRFDTGSGYIYLVYERRSKKQQKSLDARWKR